MSPYLVLAIIIIYFGVLLLVSAFTSRKSNNQSFFIGNRKSPWFVVAFGMIGASLSGVTFISVPGWVISTQFHYIQMVIGYILGYIIIVTVLLPVYYRLNLTSIYTYLGKRFGGWSYKTGAVLFLISRLIGASFRLFLVANVLQFVVFDKLGLPFEVTVVLTLALIWVYTFRGGIKTIVWTDTLQTFLMLFAVVLTVFLIGDSLNLGFGEMIHEIKQSEFSKTFDFTQWSSPTYFWKYLLSGMFITIAMTGLDQDMMQKNLSCKNLKDARKNMLTYGIAFLPVNIIFLSLGVLLAIYSQKNGISLPELTNLDDLYTGIATSGVLPGIVGVVFILGVVAAAYSSADSALTALTTSFLVDILSVANMDEAKLKKLRIKMHLLMSALLAVIIVVFYYVNNQSVIKSLFDAAGFTYGPLLGLFTFGLTSNRKVREVLVPFIALLSTGCMLVLFFNSTKWFGYKIGFEILIYNAAFTYFGLFVSGIGLKRQTIIAS